MRFLYGLIGALLGAIFGGSAAYCAVSAAMGGDGLGVFFEGMIFGPIGLTLGGIFGLIIARRVLIFVETSREGKLARQRSTFTVIGCILAAPILSAAMIWNAQQYQYPPSDQQLLSNFKHNRRTFDILAQMTQADKGLMQVNQDWTQPSDPKTVGISAERIARYRQLLNQAEAHHGMHADGLQGADFLCWAQGGATTHDTDKGYAYLIVPPKHVLNSLDQYKNQLQSEEIHQVEAYRHIEGCWYLYYDYLPG